VHYYHTDFRGNTIALTGSTGSVTDTVSYDTYGALVTRTGTTNTPFLFNGHWGVQTDSNGIYYYRARYYHSGLRRFLNQDIVLGTISSPPSLNRFAYVNGNPVSLIDPYGLMAGDIARNSVWFDPLQWSWSDYVDAANAAKSGVGDPIGTAAGLAVYTNEAGTVTIGYGIGGAGYLSISRNENGSYTITGGAGDGFGMMLSATTGSPTQPNITGYGGSFGAQVNSDVYYGQGVASFEISSNVSFDIKGNYAITPIGASAVIGAEGTLLSAGGDITDTTSGNFTNPGSNITTEKIEPQASVGMGQFFFVGVHGSITVGGSSK
jgi:RHS repeat-associated protein